MGVNFCSNCGKKANVDDIFCEKCGNRLKQTNDSVKKQSSGLVDFLLIAGPILIIAGILILVGSAIAASMQSTMETPGRHRVWAIGALVYEIFYPTGWISHSAMDGAFILVIGLILTFIENRLFKKH